MPALGLQANLNVLSTLSIQVIPLLIPPRVNSLVLSGSVSAAIFLQPCKYVAGVIADSFALDGSKCCRGV